MQEKELNKEDKIQGMRFSDIPGNEEIKKAFVSMADSGRIPHAMLLYENEGCGALPLAMAFIQYIACKNHSSSDSCGVCPVCNRMSKIIHPDVHFIFPVNSGSKISVSKPTSESYLPLWREIVSENPYFLENQLYDYLGIDGKSGNIAVAEAKAILDRLSLTAVEDGYKSVIIWLPERVNAETANRLLKVVEEPPEKTLFIFITHSPEKVLQTISSRCQAFRILPSSREQVAAVLEKSFGFSQVDAENASAIAGGSVGVALQEIGDREEYTVFQDIFSDMLRGTHSGNLLSVLEASEQISAFKSKEKQKAFCIFAGESFRKIYMVAYKMSTVANLKQEESDFFADAAAWFSPQFCEQMMSVLDRSVMLLDRNVNPKLVFCDFADRLFVSGASKQNQVYRNK